MVKGTVVHKVLEDLFVLPAVQRREEAAQRLLPGAWEHTLSRREDLGGLFEEDGALRTAQQDTAVLVGNYFRLERPANLEPKRTEQYMRVRLSSGLALSGIADRIDEAPSGDLRVVDYKTGKAPSPRFVDEALFQMRFYALMLRNMWRQPKRLQLLYLATADVLTLDPNPENIDRFEDHLWDLWLRIEADARSGSFKPVQSKLCGWCPYQSVCPLFGGTPPEPPAAGIKKLLSMRSEDEPKPERGQT